MTGNQFPRNQAPKQKTPEELGRELFDAAERRPDSCRGKMSRGANKPPYRCYLFLEPIVAKEHYGGKQQEALTHVIAMGNGTMLGITRDLNMPKQNPNGSLDHHPNPIDSVRVVVLPFGPAAEQTQSARTLLEVRPVRLTHPRENGAVQPWESFVIGRDTIAQATGVVDDQVSRQHVGITITAEGTVDIADLNSTNGTQVLSMDDFSMHGLDGEGQQVFAHLRDDILQSHPHTWDKQSADQTARIVDPNPYRQ